MSQEALLAESNLAVAHLAESSAYTRASSIALFISMPRGEFDTRSLIERAMQDNKTVYIPRVGLNLEERTMDMIALNPYLKEGEGVGVIYDEWPRNKWSIPEPPASPAPVVAYSDAGAAIDLIVVPGVAFDAFGGRLGQGAGYYDRFIANVARAGGKSPVLLGVGLNCQLQGREEGRVPTGDDDIMLDGVVGPSGVAMRRIE
jgi:5-formyltetrahydrofolate cyclo-ligase